MFNCNQAIIYSLPREFYVSMYTLCAVGHSKCKRRSGSELISSSIAYDGNESDHIASLEFMDCVQQEEQKWTAEKNSARKVPSKHSISVNILTLSASLGVPTSESGRWEVSSYGLNRVCLIGNFDLTVNFSKSSESPDMPQILVRDNMFFPSNTSHSLYSFTIYTNNGNKHIYIWNKNTPICTNIMSSRYTTCE